MQIWVESVSVEGRKSSESIYKKIWLRRAEISRYVISPSFNIDDGMAFYCFQKKYFESFWGEKLTWVLKTIFSFINLKEEICAFTNSQDKWFNLNGLCSIEK